MNHSIEIWGPYQAFYIESMLSVSSSAVTSTEKLATLFNPGYDLSEVQPEDILDVIQNIFTQAAVLSRYFWTVKKKENMHKARSQYLRTVFNLTESSPIKNRKLRNMIEHFDEKLDVFVSKPVVGQIVPNYVGLEPENNGVLYHVFRAYYYQIGIFEILGERFELQPVVDEIYEIHRKLIKFGEAGHVFRISP